MTIMPCQASCAIRLATRQGPKHAATNNKGARLTVAEERKPSRQHIWRFFRAGGFDQVRIDSGADVAELATLDQKLWVALACPTRGIEFDERTLDIIDADHDGRIRAPEMLDAVSWTTGLLKDLHELQKGGESLPLAAIDDGVDR